MRAVLVPSLLAFVCGAAPIHHCLAEEGAGAGAAVEAASEAPVDFKAQIEALKVEYEATRQQRDTLKKEVYQQPEVAALQATYEAKDKEMKSVEETDEALQAARANEDQANRAFSELIEAKRKEHADGAAQLAARAQNREERRQLEFQRELARFQLHNRYGTISQAVEQDEAVKALRKAYEETRHIKDREPSDAVVQAKQAYEEAKQAYNALLKQDSIAQAKEAMETAKRAYEDTRNSSEEILAYEAARKALDEGRKQARAELATAADYNAVLAAFDAQREANDKARKEIDDALKEIYRSIERGEDADVLAARQVKDEARTQRDEAYKTGLLGEARQARDDARRAMDDRVKELLEANSAYQEAEDKGDELRGQIRDLEKQAKAD